MGGYRQRRDAVRRVIAGVVLGVVGAATVSAGAWAAAPAVTLESAAATTPRPAAIGTGDTAPVVSIHATKFGMWWMGTVTRAAKLTFLGDPRAVIYPGYYPDGTVIGPDKSPQPTVYIEPTGEGEIYYNYDAPIGYQAFTQVIDGVASGSFGLFMDTGTDLFDNFTASVADIAVGADGASKVSLQGDFPYWWGNHIEVVSDGKVLTAGDFEDASLRWALDIPNVPAGEHNWEVRLVSEGRIIMVRNLTVIAGTLETPVAHPVAVAGAGVVGVAAVGVFVALRRGLRVG